VFRALVVAGPGGLTPGDLATQLEVGATALSFHLKELSHAQLITQERDGRYLVYRAAFDRMNALLSFMTDNCCGGQSCCPPAQPPRQIGQSQHPNRCKALTFDWSDSMKRFHVHLHVDDLAKSIGFYSQLFAALPTRQEADYAKWMLDDPRINFAISTRGAKAGIDHLGFQVDEAAELAELKTRAQNADMALLDEGNTTCCYARSEKHWITDPQGIAWEQFHTLGDIPVFSEAQAAAPAAGSACCSPAVQPAAPEAATQATNNACCTPQPRGKAIGIPVKAASGCC
jgi:lactoylglutathione lyase